MQEHDAARCPEARQRRLELEGLVDRFAHEDLRRAFAPRLQRAVAEAAGEALGAGEADAGDLDSRTVQHGDVRLRENADDLARRVRFVIVVAEHRDLRDFHRLELLGQNPGFVGEAAIGEVAAQREHVRAFGDPREERLEGAGRAPLAMEIADGGDPHGAVHGLSPVLGVLLHPGVE